MDTPNVNESLHPPFVQTVERDVVVERRTELLGVWPDDPRTQRAWAVDRILALRSGALGHTTIDELLTDADKILAYVTGEKT